MAPNPSPDPPSTPEPLEQHIFGNGPHPQRYLHLFIYLLLWVLIVGTVAFAATGSGSEGRIWWLPAITGLLLALPLSAQFRKSRREVQGRVIVTTPGLRYRSTSTTVFVPWSEVEGIFRNPYQQTLEICLVGRSSSFSLEHLSPRDLDALEKLVKERRQVPSRPARRAGPATLVTYRGGKKNEPVTEKGILWLTPEALFFLSQGATTFQLNPLTLTFQRGKQPVELEVSDVGGHYLLCFRTTKERERWYTDLTLFQAPQR